MTSVTKEDIRNVWNSGIGSVPGHDISADSPEGKTAYALLELVENLLLERDLLTKKVDDLKIAILGATYQDSQTGTIGPACQDWVDLSEMWPILKEVHKEAAEEDE